jgi:GMP synthase-like glutamine amidotransferase
MPKVTGATRIRLLGDGDPLLDGLPEEPLVMASHVDEVKDIPPGFRLLALGDPSRIQIMRADRRPLWGVQFHPERAFDADHQEGEGPTPGALLLTNFLGIAGSGMRSTG